MLLFTQGVQRDIVVTLKERTTLTDGFYLFIFTHITTKEQVKIIFAFGDDSSTYPDRYNSFTILSEIFESSTLGQYEYSIYEQESSTNEDPDLTTKLLESGKAELIGADFSFDTYTTTTSYSVYAG